MTLSYCHKRGRPSTTIHDHFSRCQHVKSQRGNLGETHRAGIAPESDSAGPGIRWNGIASMAHGRCQAGLCASAQVNMVNVSWILNECLNECCGVTRSDMWWWFEDVWSLHMCHCQCFEHVGTEVSRSSGKEMDVVVKHISMSKKTATRFAAGFFGELFPATSSSVSLFEGHWCCGLCGLLPLHAIVIDWNIAIEHQHVPGIYCFRPWWHLVRKRCRDLKAFDCEVSQKRRCRWQHLYIYYYIYTIICILLYIYIYTHNYTYIYVWIQ